MSEPKWLDTPLPPVPRMQSIASWFAQKEALAPVRRDLQTSMFLYSASRRRIKTALLEKNSTQSLVQKTNISLLYLHGFASSPKETSPLMKIISTRLKANTIIPRLPRHGLSFAPMEYIDSKEWYLSALEGLALARKLGRKVIIVSCSTGATIALLLAARLTAKSEYHSHICISPNLGVNFNRSVFFLLPHLLANKITFHLSYLCRNLGAYIRSAVRNDLHAKYNTLVTPISSLHSMFRLVLLAWKLKKRQPERFAVPVHVLASKSDAVVNFALTKKFFTRFPVPVEHLPLPESNYGHTHVLAGDAHSPESTDDIANTIISAILRLTKENFHGENS